MGTSKSCCAPKQLRYPDLSGDRTQPFPGFSDFVESREGGISAVSFSGEGVDQKKRVCRIAGLHPALPTCHPCGI